MPARESVLLFLHPDTVLHVHDLWKRGEHNVRVTRGFVIADVNERPPFVMLGLRSISTYLKGWCISAADLRILRRMPSLQRLDETFWNYLAALRFKGDVEAIPDGTVFSQSIAQSEKVKRQDPDGVTLPLVYLTDTAAVVAMTSNAIALMLDAQIEYGRVLLNYSMSRRPPTFWMSERVAHPRWAGLAAEAEYILDRDRLFDARHFVYLLWDGQEPFKEDDHTYLDPVTDEWKLRRDKTLPLGARGVSPADLARQSGAEVRLMIATEIELKMEKLRAPGDRAD